MTLKQWRTQEVLTQFDLAMKSGITVTSICRLEKSNGPMHPETYRKLMNAGVPRSVLDEMMFGRSNNAESVSDNNGDG